MNFFRFVFSKTFWVQVVLALVVTIVLGFLVMKWLGQETNHGRTIVVPDLAKMQLDEVDQTLKKLHLDRVVLDSANYNPDYPRYSVIEQNPAPGKKVKEGRKLYLKLNPAGYPKIEIPNMIRHTKRQVVPMLGSLGFEVGDITYKPDIAKDAVLELRVDGKQINPGDKIMKTTKIDLVLGDGDPEGENKKNEEEEEEEADTLDPDTE